MQPAGARRRGHGRRSDRERLAGAGERGEAGAPGPPRERLQRVRNPREAENQVAPAGPAGARSIPHFQACGGAAVSRAIWCQALGRGL